ncbi:MAG TPA: baseplate J/gp47 family protein [Acidimicrobiales bacterium]|nr:baseplate J/gp47 family protein [Acidimicrobiales bacterium]
MDSASGPTDGAGASLATTLAVTTVTVRGEFPATGVRTSATRASGAVQFFNRGPWELVVAAGTLVATRSGIRFVTQREATVPPTSAGRAGIAGVPVVAVEPGATGNVSGGDITIPLVDSLVWLASVSNPTPTQGGGRTEARFITAQDYDAAIAVLAQRFWVELDQRHLGAIPVAEERRRRLASAVVGDAVAEPSSGAVVGRTVDSFELSLRVAATVRTVDEGSPSWIREVPPRPSALEAGPVSEPITMPRAASGRRSLSQASVRRRELWRDTSIALILLGAALLLVGGLARSTASRGAVLGVAATQAPASVTVPTQASSMPPRSQSSFSPTSSPSPAQSASLALGTPATKASPAPGTLPVRAGTVEASMVQMAPGPDGGLYMAVTPGAPANRTVLALLDTAGRPQPGWPIALVGWACGLPRGSPLYPSMAADGSVRVVCHTDDGRGNALRSVAFAFDPHGQPMTGWPVQLPTLIRDPPRVVGRTLYVTDGTRVMTVAPDGVLRVGKAYAAPGSGPWFEPVLGPDGTAYLVSVPSDYPADRPEIISFDLDGVREGWSIRLTGIPSGLAFGPDGRLYVTVSTRGADTARTLVFDPDGRAVPGGSDLLPVTAARGPNGAGPASYPAAPLVAADGTAYVIGQVQGHTTVFGLDPSGKVMAGWPYRATVGQQWQGECPDELTGCGLWLAIPAVGPGDVLFLPQAAPDATAGGSLVEVGPDGHVHPGWPVTLRRPGAAIWSVVLGSDGTLWALAVEPETAGQSSATILAIAPDGTVRSRVTVVEP